MAHPLGWTQSSSTNPNGELTRLLIVVNNPDFFFQQHVEVARSASAAGYEVHVAAPSVPECSEFRWHKIRMPRGRIRVIDELRSIADLFQLLRRLQPDVVHNITHKPVLYGTLASLFTGSANVVNSNTGLGFLFIDDSVRTKIVRKLMRLGYRLSLRHKNRLDLFLNEEDRLAFIDLGMTDPDRSRVVTGPGVDLNEFHFATEPSEPTVFVLPARMLWHKGVREFVEAAAILKRERVECKFLLVGDTDPGNLAAIPRTQLLKWHEDGLVQWKGFCDDMPEIYRNSHVVVLPSYREGMGRVLQEGSAMGRALIATNVPGCREVVRNGLNGFLVRPRDPVALAQSMRILAENKDLRIRMGLAGRRMAAERWGIQKVVAEMLHAYQQRSPVSEVQPEQSWVMT